MKYSKRKDKYCCNVLNDNFQEIDERLTDLEKNGGGGGSSSNVVYLTQAEYDALPDTKLSDDIEYRITDGNIGASKASNVSYDNSFTGLKAINVQGAVDEVIDSLEANDGLKFQFATDGEGNYGYLGADDSFIPFNRGKLEKIKILDITTTQTLHGSSLPVSALYDGTIVFNSNYSKNECVCVSGVNHMNLNITVDKPFKLAFVRTPYSRTGAVYNPIAFQIEDYTSKQYPRDSNGWNYIPYFPNGDVSPGYDYLSLGTTFNIKLYSYQEHTGMSELEIFGYYE